MSLYIFILVFQAVIAIALVGVILMQRSEGGGLGVGGSSSGFMTARGASDFLTRSTAILGAMFIGLSDLAADPGHLGNLSHPQVQDAIADAIRRCREAGRTIGILAPIQAEARRWLDLGASMVAIGSDTGVLRGGVDALTQSFGRGSG